MNELKKISRDAVPRALELAERYRLLNEPEQSASICNDILEVEPDNEEALRTLFLATTEQFGKRRGTSVEDAEKISERMKGEYERAYYSGIICERWARTKLQENAQFEPSFTSKGLSASVSGAAPRKIEADPDAVGQILGNLLSNVEKYAAQGKKVEIDVSQDEAATRIAVRDYGAGIPEGHREKVFDPFYRVSDKLSDGATGTGIGLTIARELARLHGGDLVLEPAEPGIRFILKVPNAPEPRGGATA